VLEGKVTRVIDGDTLQVQASVSGPPLTVRLRDIDAPEICQVWGTQSRDALAELVKGRTVEVRTVARDVHGRTVAAVYVDGVNVGVRLVEEGHAWSARGKWDRGPLMKQERMAWSLRRGLHQDRAAINPKDFRAAHGSCTAQAAQ
jgi:endonuclease YncB( thermonuclease family)